MLRRALIGLTALAMAGLVAAPAHAGEQRPPWEKVDPVQLRERVLASASGRSAQEAGGSAAGGPSAKTSTPCWSRSAHDVVGEDANIDIKSYTLSYDCTTDMFELALTTSAATPANWMVEVVILVDTDRDWSTGCGGDFAGIGIYDPVTPYILSDVSAAPDCETGSDRGAARFAVSADRKTFRLKFRRSQIDYARSFEWGVMLIGLGTNPGDYGTDGAPDGASANVAANFEPPFDGYWAAAAGGRVAALGDAASYGDASGASTVPIVGMAAFPGQNGYWLAASNGGVFAYGAAKFHGSAGAVHLAAPVVAMASTPSGLGYWLVASDGGIFAYGDARFYGSMGGHHLNAPIVGIASTHSGLGYWLVASDGGIFAFGDARFRGSTGNLHLARPVVGMAATPRGRGYWLVASDGGIFAFGDARFHGSTGALRLVEPVVGMARTSTGQGYWLVASDGGVFAFGDAGFHGAATLGSPVTAVAN